MDGVLDWFYFYIVTMTTVGYGDFMPNSVCAFVSTGMALIGEVGNIAAVGTIFLMAVEKLDLVDGFYCVCSAVTTLGYGDKSLSTKAGRVFAVIWIWMSTTCLAQFFLYVTELYTETRQRRLADWVLTRKMTNEDLEAADLTMIM
ncbi:outward rectifying potassium channel protein [Actinidia rufa]|uniref:Outward rectifying potassium channel protein n=1 Tax=Actinidia rufa TaxID=165716 RepID=A0A7J0DY59_9ERIC|nr:outward rectifying potassium channel protein [Actinidia rufa]